MKKLIKKSAFIKDTTADSVQNRIRMAKDKRKNLPLLEDCERIWWGLDEFRRKRARNIRYVFGDQWGDVVIDEQGRYVTERERIARRTGGIVLQNNHLFKVVNSIAGVYAKSMSLPVVYARQENADAKSQMMTNTLQTNYDNNLMTDLRLDAVYETVAGGMPVFTEEWRTHEGVEDSYTFKVNPDYFFFRAKGVDPRMWDVDLVGEIRDYDLGDLAAEVAESDYDYKQLEAIYAPYLESTADIIQQTERLEYRNADFRTPPARNLCRTYHVWTLEYKPRIRVYDPLDYDEPVYRIELEDLDYIKEENAKRLAEGLAMGWTEEDIPLIEYTKTPEHPNLGYIIDQYWHFQMLSPDGYILQEYDSPYEHHSHPYVFTAHHYINGNIFPFIGVVIDQQRYINRLISLHDLAVQNAAKGIKMIPKSVLGGMSPKQFAKQFTEIGGFVFYTPDPKNPSAVPQVITTNATNIGTSELLKLEVDWINDISTVSGALQGATPSSGTAASRYAMEMQNSTTSITSLFQRLNSFELQLARKKMKVIHQYYQEPHNISVMHSNGYAAYGMYDPKAVADIDFAVSIKQEAETPVSRMLVNDLVKEMWQAGVISAKQMLRYGYFQGTDQIVQDLEAAEEQAAQGGMIQGVSPEAAQQVTQQADPSVVSAVQSALQQ